MSRNITLWSFADVDRSGKVRWTALELGYEIDEIRVKPGQHREDGYRALNPYAQIPTAELDGEILLESTAICLALAERHPEAGLLPSERRQRDRFWELVHLAGSTLEAPVVMYHLSRLGIVDAAWGPLCAQSIDQRLAVFARQAPEQGYLCGDFSIADICAAYVLRIGVQSELLALEGALAGYLARLAERPAAQAARFFAGL